MYFKESILFKKSFLFLGGIAFLEGLGMDQAPVVYTHRGGRGSSLDQGLGLPSLPHYSPPSSAFPFLSSPPNQYAIWEGTLNLPQLDSNCSKLEEDFTKVRQHSLGVELPPVIYLSSNISNQGWQKAGKHDANSIEPAKIITLWPSHTSTQIPMYTPLHVLWQHPVTSLWLHTTFHHHGMVLML